MSMTRSALTIVYTLTPTHCGTGQAAGAVDLPIAREQHTELPILPATTLKGVARDAFERTLGRGDRKVKDLFGPKIEAGGTAEDHRAGKLVFCEGKLLTFPARSLNRPFFFATCRLLIERLERDLRAFGFEDLASNMRIDGDPGALVTDESMGNQPLVVEDVVYAASEVRASKEVAELGQRLASWLPPAEEATKERLAKSLLVLPDNDFLSLVQRAVPVQARIALTDGKTTDAWIDEDGKKQSGNLWYEEAIPPDCLFATFITERFQQRTSNEKNASSPATGSGEEGIERRPAAPDVKPEWKDFWEMRSAIESVQIGGNETVGQGRCWWHAVQQGAVK